VVATAKPLYDIGPLAFRLLLVVSSSRENIKILTYLIHCHHPRSFNSMKPCEHIDAVTQYTLFTRIMCSSAFPQSTHKSLGHALAAGKTGKICPLSRQIAADSSRYYLRRVLAPVLISAVATVMKAKDGRSSVSCVSRYLTSMRCRDSTVTQSLRLLLLSGQCDSCTPAAVSSPIHWEEPHQPYNVPSSPRGKHDKP
jgi:hypothetical protein